MLPEFLRRDVQFQELKLNISNDTIKLIEVEAIDTTVYSKSNCIFERYRLRRLNEHVFVTNHKLGKTRSKKVFWDGL